MDEALDWLQDNPDADTEELEEKLKEVQDVCSPIISAAYGAAGGDGEDDEDLGSHDEL